MNRKLKPSGVFDGVEVYPISNWEDLYSISKCGKIWGHKRKGWRSPFITSNGYLAVIVSKNCKKSILCIHRALYLTFLNPSPIIEVEEVDHIDGNPLNNDLKNLRRCNRKQNSRNRGLSKNNTSGFKGVCFCKQTKKWAAYIKVNGKNKTIGRFSSKEEAALAYDKEAANLHRGWGRLNFKT